jgi:hypothetical protein
MTTHVQLKHPGGALPFEIEEPTQEADGETDEATREGGGVVAPSLKKPIEMPLAKVVETLRSIEGIDDNSWVVVIYVSKPEATPGVNGG